MMFTNRNKMIIALILAVAVAFAAYTMYAKSCACKKSKKETAAGTGGASTKKESPSPVVGGPVAVIAPAVEKKSVSIDDEVPKPVLAA